MTTAMEREWTLGYDLDGGGYEFSEYGSSPDDISAELSHLVGRAVVWDDPDPDYFPCDHRREISWASCPMLIVVPGVFDPRDVGELERLFPRSYADGRWQDDDILWMDRLCMGVVSESDHECNCHGKVVAGYTDLPPIASGDIKLLEQAGVALPENVNLDLVPLSWEFTGNTSDAAMPWCDRCGGDGYVISPAGAYAVYALQEEE